jgi:methyl-accepting chemotaxis protein
VNSPKHRLQRTALAITRWVGSLQSIVSHTLAFVGSFAAVWLGVLSFDRMLLILTTIVSLEAIYLSIFIQMTINVQGASLEEVEQDIDEIQEDIDEIQEDVDELQEDVEEMSEEEREDEVRKKEQKATLEQIHDGLRKLIQEVERLRK